MGEVALRSFVKNPFYGRSEERSLPRPNHGTRRIIAATQKLGIVEGDDARAELYYLLQMQTVHTACIVRLENNVARLRDARAGPSKGTSASGGWIYQM